MEQAVNQFTKGLQMDTNPMLQGSDTLTDALNATIITMNGNEVVLQNDMGNRRVDNAYLPSGYEPVGIKEHGGIIYIASYNPITGKSLIGSFPSPERRIDLNEESDNPISLDLENRFFSFTEENKDEEYGIYFLKNDSILIPITNDTSLHAGDKFVVYENNNSKDSELNSEDITNYDNINGDKIKSPKNKLYTLSLGILNSLNVFNDITPSLQRWKRLGEEDKIISFEDDNSDLYKFNSGYFIPKSYNPPTPGTESDEELIKERLKCAANTYAYKLVGPMYLKAELNHVRTVNFNVGGVLNKTNGENNKKTYDASIWVEATITYNCPDGGESMEEPIGNDIYYNLEEYKVKNKFFDLYYKYNGEYKRVKEPVESSDSSPVINDDNIYNKTTYDPITNLYTVKIVKKYEIKDFDKDFDYFIGVRAREEQVNGNYIYLQEQSYKGSLDLSLLGSGTIKLKEWRFLNNYNNQSTILTYAFDAYPKYGEEFVNLKFKFEEFNPNDPGNTYTYTIDIGNLYNGKQTKEFNWNYSGFNPRKLYKVKFSYLIKKLDDTVINGEPQIEDVRWFLTTELFNNCYHQASDDFVLDFGEKDNNDKYKDPIEKKLNIVPEITASVNNNISDPLCECKGLLSKSQPVETIFKNTIKGVIEFIPSINYNYKLYPDFINLNENWELNLKLEYNDNELSDKIPYSKLGEILYDNDKLDNFRKITLEFTESKLELVKLLVQNDNIYVGISDSNIKSVFKILEGSEETSNRAEMIDYIKNHYDNIDKSNYWNIIKYLDLNRYLTQVLLISEFILYNDFHISLGSQNGTIYNGFEKVENIIDNLIPKEDSYKFGCITLDRYDRTGRDIALVKANFNCKESTFRIFDGNVAKYAYGNAVGIENCSHQETDAQQLMIDAKIDGDDDEIFTFSLFQYKFNDKFGKLPNDYPIFIWGYTNSTGNLYNMTISTNGTTPSISSKSNEAARVWWRNYEGNWYFCDMLKRRNTNILKYLETFFLEYFGFNFLDLIYAFYKEENLSSLNLWKSGDNDKIWSKSYNIQIQNKFNIKYDDDSKILNIPECDILNFKQSSCKEFLYESSTLISNSPEYLNFLEEYPNKNEYYNIYIETGESNLNPRCIYDYKNNKLSINQDASKIICVDEVYCLTNKRGLTYNNSTKGNPRICVDRVKPKSDNGAVLLNYVNILLVNTTRESNTLIK